MNTNQKAYTVGRGKLYVGIFAPNTETVVGGEMYFGNTPSIAIAATYNDLPHYSSDDQNQFQDDNFTLRTDRNLTFTCDNMSMQTWGLMLGTLPVDETQAAATAVSETLTDVALGRFYQLGMDNATPDGVGEISNVTVTIGVTPVTADGNYEVDLVHGRIYVLPDAIGIDVGDDLIVEYDAVVQTSTLVVESGTPFEGSLRYIADNPKGGNKNLYWPHVKLQPSGDLQLKGDTWQTATFTAMVLQPQDTRSRVYVREPL
jgi:hypothetical protein